MLTSMNGSDWSGMVNMLVSVSALCVVIYFKGRLDGRREVMKHLDKIRDEMKDLLHELKKHCPPSKKDS